MDDDITIGSLPYSSTGGDESILFNLPDYFNPLYLLTIIILSIIILTVVVALFDAGPLAPTMKKWKKTLMGDT